MIPDAELERRLRDDPTGDPLYERRFSPVGPGRERVRPLHRRPPSWRTRETGRGFRPAASLLVTIGILIVLALAIAQVGRKAEPTPSTNTSLAPSASAVLSTDLLARIQASGVITIAVRPEQLEYRLPGSKGSFDEDVATEIAERLGVRLELVRVSTEEMLSDGSATTWDVALPSVADWLIPAERFASTQPYYYWPHFLLGPRGLTDAMISAGPICAVENDQGAEWLRGTYGDTTTPPITAEVTLRASETECLGLVQAGNAVALVTAGLTYVDAGCTYDGCTNGSIRGGQGVDQADVVSWREAPVEPRSAIVRRDAEPPERLITALDAVFDAMRTDGRLHAISNAHFGPGRDVGYATGSAP